MAVHIEGAGGMMPADPSNEITPDPTGTNAPKRCTECQRAIGTGATATPSWAPSTSRNVKYNIGFDRNGWCAVTFDYDPELIRAIKSVVPQHQRSYNPNTKVWLVNWMYRDAVVTAFRNAERRNLLGGVA